MKDSSNLLSKLETLVSTYGFLLICSCFTSIWLSLLISKQCLLRLYIEVAINLFSSCEGRMVDICASNKIKQNLLIIKQSKSQRGRIVYLLMLIMVNFGIEQEEGQLDEFDYYIQMSYLICEKHNKFQKSGNKVPNNGYICMNRYCPESFKVFCSACKNDHRDHSIKILTIEDVSFLVQRLLKAPFNQVGRVISQSLDIMKKLKLIKEFRKKIDILQKEIQKESLKLIEHTQLLISQYSFCKENVSQLSNVLGSIEGLETYNQFISKSKQLLANLDYNFKKDKFEFGSSLIKQKEDKKRKSVDRAKRKIEEVRDYSMKIIEVILHNDDSDQEEQDLAYQKKHYQVLKQQLCLDKNEKELQEQISQMKNSNATTNKSQIKKDYAQDEVQTQERIVSIQQCEQKIKSALTEINHIRTKQQNDFKLKIAVATKQKQNLNRELLKIKGKFQQKKRKIVEIQSKLQRNKTLREQKSQIREEIMNKIIQFSQMKMANSEQKNDQ